MKFTIESLILNFPLISEERKAIISRLASEINKLKEEGKAIKLNYICTHNSRRSHFGQIAGAIAAQYYGFQEVETFSGGTEITRIHQNTIAALQQMGFQMMAQNENEQNPIYKLYVEGGKTLSLWSKTFNDAKNPSSDFIAIMTCSSAETNCPFVPGAKARISLTYDDPKLSDGSGKEMEVYTQTFYLILTEQLYAFSLLK